MVLIFIQNEAVVDLGCANSIMRPVAASLSKSACVAIHLTVVVCSSLGCSSPAELATSTSVPSGFPAEILLPTSPLQYSAHPPTSPSAAT
jgi:hypothetical protein